MSIYVTYWVTGFTNPNRLHHAGISQLTNAEFSLYQQWALVFVGFDATDKKGLTSFEGLHESIQ
jgi:hypothetical protein